MIQYRGFSIKNNNYPSKHTHTKLVLSMPSSYASKTIESAKRLVDMIILDKGSYSFQRYAWNKFHRECPIINELRTLQVNNNGDMMIINGRDDLIQYCKDQLIEFIVIDNTKLNDIIL